MTEHGPSPPFEIEPTSETEKKYRTGIILVAIFAVVLLAVAIIVIAS